MTRQARWRRSDLQPLEAQLKEAASKRLREVFKDPDGRDDASYHVLARIARTALRDTWEEDQTRALILLMRAAVARLSDEKPKDCATTWKDIGIVLYGFRTDLPAKPDATPYRYSDYVAVAREEAGFEDRERTFRRIVASTRKLLAAELLSIEAEAINDTIDLQAVARAHAEASTTKHHAQGELSSSINWRVSPNADDIGHSSGEMRSLVRAPMFSRRLVLWAVTAVVVLVAAAAGFAFYQAAVPSTIDVTVKSVRSGDYGWHATFMRGDGAAAAPFLSQANDQHPVPSDFDAFLKAELVAGAYLAHGAIIKVEVRAPQDREVTITEVVVTDLVSAPIADGVKLVLTTEGNQDDLNMALNLDSARPTAKDYDFATGAIGRPYFAGKHIKVSAGSSEVLGIVATASRNAKSFRLQISYSMAGEEPATQVVSLGGTPEGAPFRVTPDSCVGAFQVLSAEDRDRLSRIRYSDVRVMAIDSTSGGYVWRDVPPREYEQCH